MTLDELQKIINDFVEERNIGTTVEHRMLDLLSEAGELSKEVLKSTDYGKRAFEKNNAFKDELGDVFFFTSMHGKSNRHKFRRTYSLRTSKI